MEAYSYEPSIVDSIDVFHLVLTCILHANLLKVTLASPLSLGSPEGAARATRVVGARICVHFATSRSPGTAADCSSY